VPLVTTILFLFFSFFWRKEDYNPFAIFWPRDYSMQTRIEPRGASQQVGVGGDLPAGCELESEEGSAHVGGRAAMYSGARRGLSQGPRLMFDYPNNKIFYNNKYEGLNPGRASLYVHHATR